MELDIIKQILMSSDDYWVLAKKSYITRCFTSEREEDDIIFVAIPHNIERGIPYEEITLKQVEQIDRLYLDFNIFLNSPYAPFQSGISFHGIYKGFPVTGNIRAFINEAISTKKDYYQLKEMMDAMNKPAETVTTESL